MHEFYIIKIKNKKVYLMVDDNGKVKWTNKKNDGLWFSEENEATSFASNHFKRFENWTVEKLEINI